MIAVRSDPGLRRRPQADRPGLRRATGLVLALVPALVACAPAEPPSGAGYDPSGLRPAVEAAVAECTAAHGYAPGAGEAMDGTDGLAPGERAWRDCVYRAIETDVLPNTRAPEAWRRLIAEDRAMTDAVADGRLSAEGRQARLDALTAEIRAAEAAAVAAADPRTAEAEARAQTDFVRRMVNDLR